MSANEVVCFWCAPQGSAEESLRRFILKEGSVCPGPYKYHNAVAKLGETPYPLDEYNGYGLDNAPHDDPRWPKKCDYCDYVFKEEDNWQHNLERIYQEAVFGGEVMPNGRRFPLRDAPPGAMWDGKWYWQKGPDGLSIYVQTPGGEWCIDSPANNSKKPWDRTGVPPKITARPSILIGDRYHGWLTDGVLKAC
jgi:hypothetical protein